MQRAEGRYVDSTKGRVTVQAFAEGWFKNAQPGVGVRRGLRPKKAKWVRDPPAAPQASTTLCDGSSVWDAREALARLAGGSNAGTNPSGGPAIHGSGGLSTISSFGLATRYVRGRPVGLPPSSPRGSRMRDNIGARESGRLLPGHRPPAGGRPNNTWVPVADEVTTRIKKPKWWR